MSSTKRKTTEPIVPGDSEIPKPKQKKPNLKEEKSEALSKSRAGDQPKLGRMILEKNLILSGTIITPPKDYKSHKLIVSESESDNHEHQAEDESSSMEIEEEDVIDTTKNRPEEDVQSPPNQNVNNNNNQPTTGVSPDDKSPTEEEKESLLTQFDKVFMEVIYRGREVLDSLTEPYVPENEQHTAYPVVCRQLAMLEEMWSAKEFRDKWPKRYEDANPDDFPDQIFKRNLGLELGSTITFDDVYSDMEKWTYNLVTSLWIRFIDNGYLDPKFVKSSEFKTR